MYNCTVKFPLGFEMDRNVNDINSEFIRLNDAGLLTDKAKQKEKGDYTVRYGITKEPLFKKIDATKMMPPLHYWITQLNHIESFAYHINTPVEKFPKKQRVMRRGKRKGKAATAYIKDVAKKQFISEAKTKLGLLLDSPSGSGTGGSTDGANNARVFFSEEKRDAVLELFKARLYMIGYRIGIFYLKFPLFYQMK